MIRVVGLGPGAPEAVPALALAALAEAPRVVAPALDPALAAVLPVQPGAARPRRAAPRRRDRRARRRRPTASPAPCPAPRRCRRARRCARGRSAPRSPRWPRSACACAASAPGTGSRRPRRSSPTPSRRPSRSPTRWRPVAGGLPDELGDLLFQSVFLAQLLEEEEGGADLAAIARGQADKLDRRHPHVYGDASAETASGVVDLWERRKREERAAGPAGSALLRPARGPPRAGLRHEGAEARRRAPASTTRTSPRPSRSWTRRRPSCATTPARGSWATSSSPRWPWPARSGPTPSSPSGPRRSASAAASRRPPAWPPRPATTSRPSPSRTQLRYYEQSAPRSWNSGFQPAEAVSPVGGLRNRAPRPKAQADFAGAPRAHPAPASGSSLADPRARRPGLASSARRAGEQALPQLHEGGELLLAAPVQEALPHLGDVGPARPARTPAGPRG